jgi:hypothetical protein
VHLLIKNNAKFAEIYNDTFPSPVDDTESVLGTYCKEDEWLSSRDEWQSWGMGG